MGERRSFSDTSLVLSPGMEIKGYKILSVIPGEGWGRVYKAERENGDLFAFKTIRPDLAEIPAYRERFRREQSALAKLREHPSLLPAHDWNKAEKGLLWLAVPWIDGPTLHGVLAEGPIPPQRAADLIAQAAEGVDAVHSKFGYVHRDLHPANLMVQAGDHLRVIDFGLARPFDHVSGSPLPRKQSIWASPEALHPGKLTAASDVYTLGLVLAYLVTDRTPQANSPVFPSGTELPEPLLEVIRRATSKRPRKRYQSAREMAEALRAIEWEMPRPAQEASPRARREPRRVRLSVVGLAGCAAAVGSFLLAFLLAGSGQGASDQAIAARGISVAVPATWKPSRATASDRGRGLSKGAAGGGATVLIGSTSAQGLPPRAPANDPREVALPAGRALRIDAVEDFDANRMFVFHVGSVYPILVCRGGPQLGTKKLNRICGRIAASVRLHGRSGAVPVPAAALRQQAAAGLHAYAAARRDGSQAIEAAQTRAAVAAAAEEVAAVAAKAANSVSAARLKHLRRALQEAAEAWERAAEAARAGAGFHAAGEGVKQAEQKIRAARIDLLRLGFRTRSL